MYPLYACLPCGGFTAESAEGAGRVLGDVAWASYTLIGTGRMRSTGMDKIDLNEMKEDWLAGNAVVAFVGALLLGQAWEVSEGTVQLFRILTVPSFMGLILLALIAGLFGLSLTLALASLVTPLQSWALSTTRSFSTALWWVVLLSFFLSLGYAFSALPPNQWWSPVLRLGVLLQDR